MKTNIEVGDYKVISSGSIVTNNLNDKVKFYIENLYFELYFQNDSENLEQRVEASPLDNASNGILLTFINFNNQLGTGNVSPIKIGFIRDKELYLNYVVYALIGEEGLGGKIIHYTWLTKTMENGKKER